MKELLSFAKNVSKTSTWVPIVAMLMSGILDPVKGENIWKVYVLYAIISVSKEVLSAVQTHCLCRITDGDKEKGEVI